MQTWPPGVQHQRAVLKRFFAAIVSGLVKFFLTGILAMLPRVVSGFVLIWIVGPAHLDIGPSSRFGKLIESLTDPHQYHVVLAAGYFVAVLLLIILGFLVTRATAHKLRGAIDSTFAKIPLFGKIYAAVGQVVDLFDKKNESSLDKFMGIAQIRMGNVKMLGLLTSVERFTLTDGREHYLIFIPNSPIPATGFNVLVPVNQCNILDMPVEDMAKMMMSLGILGPKVLRGPLAKLRAETVDHE